MSAATEPRWYVLNSMHMATLCAGREDAEACVKFVRSFDTAMTDKIANELLLARGAA